MLEVPDEEEQEEQPEEEECEPLEEEPEPYQGPRNHGWGYEEERRGL